MLQTKKVRQGALVLHIEPDGKVEYEICLPIPKGFIFDSSLFKDSVYTINNRRYLRKYGLTWESAMKYKLFAQIKIDGWKSEQCLNRKNARQERLHEFYSL